MHACMCVCLCVICMCVCLCVICMCVCLCVICMCVCLCVICFCVCFRVFCMCWGVSLLLVPTTHYRRNCLVLFRDTSHNWHAVMNLVNVPIKTRPENSVPFFDVGAFRMPLSPPPPLPPPSKLGRKRCHVCSVCRWVVHVSWLIISPTCVVKRSLESKKLTLQSW